MLIVLCAFIFQVQIDFCGDGDVVEVAGSFNGWHHPIKMDPQPSSSDIDLGESRFWIEHVQLVTIHWLHVYMSSFWGNVQIFFV